ncbi:MAG: insulinase family protein [Candidatus Marinimicrobia bacterium]|nr:insulinase family protein [Candidatus Neomarinimicrobiota bacterium]MCF7880631.1 insulinase family protein [Candidatus Neomarinimicrobiota bacterium]
MQPHGSINKTVLDNGITVVSEHVDFVRSAAVGLWVEAGSRDETPENNGVAHFMEHMVFKGTENRSPFEIANAIENFGGQINAFTGKELTCFYARVLDDYLPDAIDVLSDITLHPLFLPNDIEREKSVVLEELSDIEDTPSDLIHELFVDQVFPNHPLGYNILGTRESIQNLSADKIREFTSHYYLPERLVVSVAGHVNHDALVKLVENSLGNMDSDITNPRTLTPPPASKTGARSHTNGQQQSHFVTGVRTFAYDDERRFALLVLNTILSGGMSGRLFQNIREQYGFVYSIYSFMDFYLDDGYFGVYVGTEKSRLEFMQEKVREELESLVNEQVSDAELGKVKTQVKGSIVLSLENMFNRMTRIAKQDIYYNEFQSMDEFMERVEAVTVEDLHKLAGELFRPDRFITSILKPSNNHS